MVEQKVPTSVETVLEPLQVKLLHVENQLTTSLPYAHALGALLSDEGKRIMQRRGIITPERSLSLNIAEYLDALDEKKESLSIQIRQLEKTKKMEEQENNGESTQEAVSYESKNEKKDENEDSTVSRNNKIIEFLENSPERLRYKGFLALDSLLNQSPEKIKEVKTGLDPLIIQVIETGEQMFKDEKGWVSLKNNLRGLETYIPPQMRGRDTH